MKIYGINIFLVLLVFVVTLGFAFGARAFLYSSSVERPLAELLDGMDFVEEYDLGKNGDGYRITVKFGDVADLREAYIRLREGIGEITGDAEAEVILYNSRDATLAEDYYKMHYSLEEALATGRFTDMAERVEMISRSRGLDDCRIQVDADAIYLQLKRGENRMNVIIDRAEKGEANLRFVDGGGGDLP